MDAPDKADLLYGAAAIATHCGLSTAQVYHLIADSKFPSFKIGRKVCARRSSLNDWLAKCEARARDVSND